MLKTKHKVTDALQAIRIVPNAKIRNPARMEPEINLMKMTDHPHIIKQHDLFDDARNIYLVMELSTGRELFDYIVTKKHLTEGEARSIIAQLQRTLNYLHSHETCHRDLKPENLLSTEADVVTSLELIDFGLSKMIGQCNEQTIRRVGTLYYISPEVLTGNYGEQCDMRSARVILYVLICDYPPFYGHSDSAILVKVGRGVYNYNGAEWASVSPSVKDLIDHLLVMQPEDRLTAEKALSYPWVVPTRVENMHLNINIDSLVLFIQLRKLRKSVLLCIASQCSERESEDLKAKFEKLDTSGDGMLAFSELQHGLHPLSTTEPQEGWENMDIDRSGFIDYSDFLAATLDRSVYLQEEKLWSTFLTFDKDGSGKISAEVLRDVLGREGMSTADPNFGETLVCEADRNCDGEIDFIEFMDMMGERKMAIIVSRLGSPDR